MPKGYIVASLKSVIDPDKLNQYRSVVGPTIEKYGGRVLAAAGPLEKVEGDYNPLGIVLLEFDSVERAKEWYESEEYREPKALRHASAVMDAHIVQGLG